MIGQGRAELRSRKRTETGQEGTADINRHINEISIPRLIIINVPVGVNFTHIHGC